MIDIRLRKRRGEFALDVAFHLAGPGVVALFGRSGCGKTTIIDLIAGLLAPDDGSVHLDEAVLYDARRAINVAAERRRIGYVFQDSRLFPHMNVLRNLRYGEERTPGEQHVGFDEVIALLGLTHLLRRRPHELSGGERQRVALGRALLSHPRLLLLDEPLASLDLARREELLPYLERLRDRLSIPIVYVSHQFEEVLRLATHVVLLQGGAVVAQGDVVSVSLTPELRAIVGSEALGAVLEGDIEAVDATSGLARLRVGRGTLNVQADGLAVGRRLRVQLLARDLILAVQPPRGLSVRNCLEGKILRMTPEEAGAELVEIDVGGATVMAKVTANASTELALAVGRHVWVLVKSVALRGHVYPATAMRHATAGPEVASASRRVAREVGAWNP
ncbi:MAG TPA: molybdenum ABC transporter ATP-binding protein [Steroidobacteraceae bacterium]|nr:molybdenum ABC transporter ATP-binding protein [Steroidobacteraceae bacterium]